MNLKSEVRGFAGPARLASHTVLLAAMVGNGSDSGRSGI